MTRNGLPSEDFIRGLTELEIGCVKRIAATVTPLLISARSIALVELNPNAFIEAVPFPLFKGLRQKPQTDPTRLADFIAETVALEYLERQEKLSDFTVITEERGEISVGDGDERLVFLLDPIDASDNWCCHMGGAVSLTAYWRPTEQIISAVVLDLQNRDLFYADVLTPATLERRGGQYGGELMKPTLCRRLSAATVSLFAMKPERVQMLFHLRPNFALLCNRLSLSFSGAAHIVRVGAGDIDASLDCLKGYKSIDLCGPAFIAFRAGAYCRTLDGEEIQFTEDLTTRQMFICASTEELYEEVLQQLGTETERIRKAAA